MGMAKVYLDGKLYLVEKFQFPMGMAKVGDWGGPYPLVEFQFPMGMAKERRGESRCCLISGFNSLWEWQKLTFTLTATLVAVMFQFPMGMAKAVDKYNADHGIVSIPYGNGKSIGILSDEVLANCVSIPYGNGKR